MTKSSWPHGLQQARLLCPSLSPRVCSDLCPLSRWYHPTISSSVTPFSSCPQFFPSITVFSSLSSNDYSGLIFFRIDWFDLDVQGKGNSLLQHHSLKASILWCSAFFMVQLSYLYMTTGKTIALTIWTFGIKVMSQLFNMLSRFVIAFLNVAYQWVNVSL